LKEQIGNSDGLRILIARYRPRYLPKDKENWDHWWKDLAPSRELWRAYIKDKKIDWPEYKRRYIQEIKNNPEAVQLLLILSSYINNNDDGDIQKYNNIQGQEKMYDIIQEYNTITFLCHCKDEKYCHRSIIKEMILSGLEE
jgi:uncharacterized protein YeaO (DUF488 family)